MSRLALTSLIVAFVLGAALPAQPPISGVVSPAVAIPGQQVTLTITGVQNVNLPTPCVFHEIRRGSPTGPSVLSIFCILLITPLNAGSSLSANWTPPVGFQPDTYWFQVSVIGFPDQLFCFELRSPGSQAPVLTASTPAKVGQDLVMSLSAPLLPGSPYVAAASLTSNTGLPVGSAVACLDADLVFGLSFPVPDPTLFTSFAGATDSSGNAGGITVHVPNVPALSWFPLKVQVAVIDPSTVTPVLSNGLSFTIQP